MDVGALLQAICFYAFAGVAVASGVMVISARNPVHTVLFLILAFFTAASLFVMVGAEFLAMLLVAMIGAIVLTLRARQGVRRQKIATQVGRPRAQASEVVKVRPRQGV